MADDFGTPARGPQEPEPIPEPTAEELAAAEELDARIDRALSGRASATDDPVVSWLMLAVRTNPPASVEHRVALARIKVERARLRPLRIALGFMAYLFLSHGIGNIVSSDWIARNVGDARAPHGYLEGGLALMALGVLVAGSLFRRSWMPAAVAAGVPLGLALGVLGVGEVGTFGAGAALHLTQAAVAVAVGVMWWRLRRYRRGLSDEERA